MKKKDYADQPIKEDRKIKLDPKYEAILENRGLNYAARLQKPFVFKPTSFTSSVPGLKPKIVSRESQMKMLEAFLEDPFRPATYCVVSAPNDGMAKLLAAYMMQHAVIHRSSGLPVWHDLTQSFKNPLIEDQVHASLVVLNNVGSTSTPTKIEKCRDILTHYANVPRIVVSTGCDPFMFFTQYLFMPMNACAYMTTEQVKRDYEL